MENADDPSRNATQPSQNDDSAPEGDQHYYAALRTHIQIFLPFLTRIINNSEQLNIPPDNVSKLQQLYKVVDQERPSPDRLQNIKRILYNLYGAYGNSLNFHLPPDFKTSWMQETKLTDKENKVSSDGTFTSNKINQNQNREFGLTNDIQVPANLEDSKIESLSTPCQDTVKNTPTIEYSLKVRCLPGDKLSIHKPGSSSSIDNIYDMPLHKSLINDTNSINKNVDLNIDNGSNDKRFPLLNSRISDVKRLEKRIVKTFKLISKASGNNDLNMWMKAKTNCETVLPNYKIFLDAGHQIVNNGEPIDGVCHLIDTEYSKDYKRKFRDFPMSLMKSRLAFVKMSALPSLLDLFKCMDKRCALSFRSKEEFKHHMANHFLNAKRKKKNQICNVEHFKMCAYCFKMFEDEESLANHIAENYTFCKYFCPHCFYRAYTASHVMVHQSVVHTDIPRHSVIQLKYDDSACKYPKEMLLVVDFNEFVLPYKCNIGCCDFFCYLHNKFIEHLNQKHQQCAQFYCYICANKDNGEGFFALNPSLLIKHFKLHNLNKYQCIFCLYGSEIVDPMIMHLALEHFEYEPLCLERSMVSDDCESNNIRNLKILSVKKVIDDRIIRIVNLTAKTLSEPSPQQSNKRSIEGPDALSIAMKSARTEEGSQASSIITLPNCVQMAESSTSKSLAINNEYITIDDDDNDVNQNDMHESVKITRTEEVPQASSIITHPNCVEMAESSTSKSFAINNESIMIDDDDDYVNQNDMHESVKRTRILSESNNKEKIPKVSSNDDFIVIDDDEIDVNLSEKQEFNNGPTNQKCLKNRSNNVRRLVFPLIELDNLFVCKKCEKVFSDGEMYFAHLKYECPFWNNVAERKCLHCYKIYKSAYFMIEHIKLHGPDRFCCYVCNLEVPSLRAIQQHMRLNHKIKNIEFVPLRPNLTNLNKDNFIAFENKTYALMKQKLTNKLPFKGNTAPINVSQWVCNICSNGLRYTENQIKSHINMTHKVSSMFKCSVCQFESKDDNPNIFEEHYKLQHPNVAVKRLRVFEKVTDKEEKLLTELNKNKLNCNC